jgi:uncharacterized protein (TIGR02453 family)
MESFFSKKTIGFFIELGLNNHKSWFLENKDRYEEYVLEPFKTLVTKLAGTMIKIDPDFVTEPKVDKTISRIYKDIRFSKDKRPYRNNAWITFKTLSDDWKTNPCFYFEITPELYRYGMGFYNSDTKKIRAFRSSLDKNIRSFKKIVSIINENAVFRLEGIDYKKITNPGYDDAVWQYYRKKSFYLASNHDIDGFLFSKNLSEKICADFLSLKTFYEFLKNV